MKIRQRMAYYAGLLLGAALGLSQSLAAPEIAVHSIQVDGKRLGRAYEGVGALSAGASSRLLYDYPEPQRSDILDYLFKPNFGASLQHLKVEIGGDVNSTDGSEPSHAITREEFEHARPEYFKRGYEWWLMKEAKKRNPNILLEGLQWGAPGWIGNGQFFSEENAEFVSSWIKGMKDLHHLEIDYVGIWNERVPDTAYVKLLRRVLDKNGLQRVKIDAGDLWEPQEKWNIADKLEADPQLRDAVAAINAHTTAFIHWFTPTSAKKLKLPLWDGEAHALGGDWYAAAEHARFNRAYSIGRITKMISWSLITAYHDYLVAPNSGMMKANMPWCGYYEVQPPLWVIAHTTQFAQVGWRYLDSACEAASAGPQFVREGYSVTALKSDKTDDYSIIIESMDAKEPQKIKFTLANGLSRKKLSVWRSVFKQEVFSKLEDVVPSHGTFEITISPNAIYSVTTTTGQAKGIARNPIPEQKPFPFPYKSDFENEELGKPGRYFSDQHGTFEVAANPAGTGKCLKQLVPAQGIQWREQDVPHTAIGEMSWSNYVVSVDVLLPESGSATLWGRVSTFHKSGPHMGYGLELSREGKWKLLAGKKELKSGVCEVAAGKWYALQLSFAGKQIAAVLNRQPLAQVEDETFKHGAVALATGWNTACFDHVAIQK